MHHHQKPESSRETTQPREDGAVAGRPRISVITPSYNQAEFIGGTIESVLAQGGDDWQHIVVDGGSTDQTVAILEGYPHLQWVSEPDDGQSDALNKAMNMSRGDVIFWINSDDLVAPGAFAAARRFFDDHPDARIVCGNAVTVDRNGLETNRTGPRVRAKKLRFPWDGCTSMHQPSIVFRREVYDAVGPFDASLRFAMDYDFFLRASRHFDFHHAAEDFGLFRIYHGTKTGEGAAASFFEVRDSLLRYVRENGDGSPIWTAFCLHFAEAGVWVNDAVAHYLNGEPEFARPLLVRALLRNPLSLFSRRHLYYRVRQLVGPDRYDRLRRQRSGGL